MNALAWFYKSSFHSGLGLETPHIDESRAVPNERYACLTCHRRGPLTENGRCGNCGSDAVISVAVIEK